MSGEKTAKEKFLDNIKTESPLNKEDGSLPYAYFKPDVKDGEELVWFCGPDAEGRITSVFKFTKHGIADKRPEYLPNENVADQIREELKKAGKEDTLMEESTG